MRNRQGSNITQWSAPTQHRVTPTNTRQFHPDRERNKLPDCPYCAPQATLHVTTTVLITIHIKPKWWKWSVNRLCKHVSVPENTLGNGLRSGELDPSGHNKWFSVRSRHRDCQENGILPYWKLIVIVFQTSRTLCTSFISFYKEFARYRRS